MEASQTDVLFYDIFSVFVQFPAVTRHGSLRFCWVYHSYIVPTARSTSRVEYIPSTYRIFVKFEDSSSSTISRKCATQWLNSSVSTLSAYLIFFYYFFVLYARYLRAPSTPSMSGKPQAWARRQQSEATFPNPLRSLQISCRHWRPALAFPDPLGQIAFLKDVSLQWLAFFRVAF